MENKKIITVTSLVSLLIFGLGSLWHFVFAWVPYDILGIIFPVNESPWEHVKLLFFPAIIGYSILYFYYGKDKEKFLPAHAMSLLIMPILMFILFYAYRFMGVDENLILDIIITFIVIMVGSVFAYKFTFSDKECKHGKKVTFIIPITLFILYSILTYVQPKVGIFMHYTGDYGILEEYGDHDHDDHDHEEDDH